MRRFMTYRFLLFMCALGIFFVGLVLIKNNLPSSNDYEAGYEARYEAGYCQGKSQGWLEGRHPELDANNTQCKFELGYEYPESYEFIEIKDFKRESAGIYDCVCENEIEGRLQTNDRVECPDYIPKDWNKYCETARRYDERMKPQ